MPANQMKYTVHPQNDSVAIIKLGENVLGGNEALSFTTTLHEIVVKKLEYVIIDLKDVKLINSSGLGMLVSGLSTLKKHNIELILASVPDKVMYLLGMTHLDKVFKIFGDVEEALKDFG